jgi:hypothetical protein
MERLTLLRDFWTKVRSLGVFLAKFWVTAVKLVVEFEKKKLFLSFDPLTASFDLFVAVRGLFHDFSDLSPKI